MMIETFVIQSDVNNLREVEEYLFHFCNECNIGSYYSAVSVAVLQAVENAIVHGNGSDAEKKVTISLGTCRRGIFAEVNDEGAGFDFGRFGRLGNSDSGNGIFVMRQLSDRMGYSNGGRKVRLEFEVNGIDPADALYRVSLVTEKFSLQSIVDIA